MIDFAKLKEPFPASAIEWRIAQAGKTKDGKPWAKVLAYLTNRSIMDRLDEVCGPANWWNHFSQGPSGGVVCGITIKTFGAEDEFGTHITKYDGAENTDIEGVKGGLSDSQKRAGVQWGIGRYLYDLEEGWAQIVDKSVPGARYANCKIKTSSGEEWITFYWLPPELPSWALPSVPQPGPSAVAWTSAGVEVKPQKPDADGPPPPPPLPMCPKCKTSKNTIAGRPQYGGGLVCYKKNGGCGEKWATSDHPFTGKAKEKADAEAAKKPLATEAPPAPGSPPENPKDMVSKKCQILAYVHAMKNISETEPVRLRANALMDEGRLTVAERAEIEQAVIDALGRLASAKVGLPLTATKYEPPPTTPRSPDEPW